MGFLTHCPTWDHHSQNSSLSTEHKVHRAMEKFTFSFPQLHIMLAIRSFALLTIHPNSVVDKAVNVSLGILVSLNAGTQTSLWEEELDTHGVSGSSFITSPFLGIKNLM
jgi:hypothetical protein